MSSSAPRFNVLIAAILAVLAFVTIAESLESGSDLAQPCCVGACTLPKEKYFSVDLLHDMCGECCMDPKNYKLFHLFEKNLTKAAVPSPCHLINSPTPGEGLHTCVQDFSQLWHKYPPGVSSPPKRRLDALRYSKYVKTVTHGISPISMTLDLYAPANKSAEMARS